MDFDIRISEIKKMDLSRYELIDIEKLADLNALGIILRHKKSGARLALISNDDENKVFSIGFKTPPCNDTGLQHILEHSTLCGSRKYPVKDPFVELCKGSLNTFLNAMTYPDKTVYPVASCNDADFKNISDVYLDAVFYPDIYNNKKIFMQEGWHYELENEDADLEYNGVVYNEMKGAFSSPDDLLSRYTFNSLFPDNQYSNESGGIPEAIPDLTYEDFLDYHRKYYHPSNSYIYLYGDFDIQERLDYLDREYLSNFDCEGVNIDSEIKEQKAFSEIVELEYSYPVTENESLDNNSYLSWNVVVGNVLDEKLYLAMQILDYALILAPGARLKQALVDAGIGTDVYSNYESSVLQPVYSVVVKNADNNRAEEFKKIIYDVFKDIAENGIDSRMIDAGINYYEFKYRESDYGSFPKGLMNYLTMMDSWLYDDTKPFIHIDAGKTFEIIKKEKNEGLFENIVKEYFINNTHGSVITLVPDKQLEKVNDLKLRDKLAEYKNSLSPEQIHELVDNTTELKAYQDEPSSQEALKTIPMLSLKDIGKEPGKIYNSPCRISDIDVVHHNIFTNKIAYILLAFDCACVPDELVPYIGLLTTTLGLMDTENFTYADLTNEININCGGISTDEAIYTNQNDRNKYRIMYEVKGKALYEKIPFVLKMMEEMIYHTNFSDYKRLKEIIARCKSRIETSMMNSGHTVAALSGISQFSVTGYYSDKMRGYGYYELINRLDSEFESLKEDIAWKLNELVKLIFNKNNLIVSITSDEEGIEDFSKALKEFEPKIADNRFEKALRSFKPAKVKKAFSSSSQVNYVARCGDFINAGYEYTGAMKVLKVIFSYDYLWINVRVKGGAYGCMSAFGKKGDMYMVSYRDPNLKKTNEIFEKAGDYLESFNVSDRDMLKFIIGTIGDVDTPLTPSAKGVRSFSAYMSDITMEDLVKERNEILYCTAKDIRALAPLVRDTINQNYLCVVGNQKEIEKQSDLFDEIKPLFINE